jgi:hypothetical protein
MMIVWDGEAAGTYQEFVISGDEFDQYSVKWAERVDMYYRKIGALT